jgi:uncharacterized iron-regulated protein
VGENHGHPIGLAAAAALWEDTLASPPPPAGRGPALSMEFLERDEQAAVDDYLTGVTDLAAFQKKTNRLSAERFPPGHRRMVEAARAHRAPVIASNAPMRYVRIARTDGYDRLMTLTPAQRALFTIPMVVPGRDDPYRQRFDQVMDEMRGHGGTAPPPVEPESHDAGFRSQTLWDWTMAESIHRARASSDGPFRPVVHIVGRFHSDQEGGLVQALRRLEPGASILTISFIDDDPGGPPRLRDEDKGRADLVIYAGKGRG